MNQRAVKIPGPDHPIDIKASGNTWRALYQGQVIAESSDVLVMQETTYPPVAYFPRKDVKMELLKSTDHHSYCPYKGEANYFSVQSGESLAENAVWSYEEPFPAVQSIGTRLAFYTNKLDVAEEV